MWHQLLRRTLQVSDLISTNNNKRITCSNAGYVSFQFMWTCPLCNQQFVKNQQVHSCGDKVLSDFLQGKSDNTIALFRHFVECYQQIGKVTVHPTKSMIAIAAKTRIAYVTRLGKDFVDVVFPFMQSYDDNLCFHKIAKVPGQLQFNHHFRMYRPEDVNEEVQQFMRLAYDLS